MSVATIITKNKCHVPTVIIFAIHQQSLIMLCPLVCPLYLTIVHVMNLDKRSNTCTQTDLVTYNT